MHHGIQEFERHDLVDEFHLIEHAEESIYGERFLLRK